MFLSHEHVEHRALSNLTFSLAVALAQVGCVAAAAAGAGAATAVYFTSRGAESTLGQPIDQVASRSKSVLSENGIPVEKEKSEKGGDHVEYEGKANDRDITVTLDRQGPELTKVEVSAQKNLVEWDKDFAKKLVGEIAMQEKK